MSRSTVRTSTPKASDSAAAVAGRPWWRRSSSIRRCWRSTRSLARWAWRPEDTGSIPVDRARAEVEAARLPGRRRRLRLDAAPGLVR